jgi:hypothetical protein
LHSMTSLQATVSAAISCAAERCRHAATAQTAALAELVLAMERHCHDAAMQMAMSVVSSLVNECHHHEAAAQAAELAVLLLLTEEQWQHEATELATMSAMRSLAASRDCADIEVITYKAPALPTTTLPEPPAMLSPSPRPNFSYLGAVLNTNGGGHWSSHSTLPTVAASTSLSIVKDQPLRIHHRAQPCCRTGRHHRPCAPSPLDKVLPSSPIPSLGGGLMLHAVNNQQTVC